MAPAPARKKPSGAQRCGVLYEQRAEQQSTSATRRKEFVAQISRIASQLARGSPQHSGEQCDSDPKGPEDWTQLFSTAKLGRRMKVSPDHNLDADSVAKVNEVYCAEQEFLEEVQKLAITSVFEKQDEAPEQVLGWDGALRDETPYDELEKFQCIWRQTIEKTDMVTARNAFTADSITQNPVGRQMSVADEAILEDFWQVCSWPNRAEEAMLCRATRQPLMVIRTWFSEKLVRCAGPYDIKRRAGDKGPW